MFCLPEFASGTWCTTIVIDTRRSCVVRKAIVVVVNLVDALLQHADHCVKGTKAIGIIGTSRMRARDWNDSIVTGKLARSSSTI